MPINRTLRKYYPADWRKISHFVRFVRENGICENCGRHHGITLRQLNDGRWYDPITKIWRDKEGHQTFWPDIFEYGNGKTIKVYLAAAHKDHDPRIVGDNQYDRIAAWCQRCHLNHDRPYHLRKRRLLMQARFAIADFFLGEYGDIDLVILNKDDVKYNYLFSHH
jgi:hypothetical protein